MTYVVRRKQPRHDGTRYYNDRGPCARDPNGGAEYDSAEEADAARRGLREPHLWEVLPMAEAVALEIGEKKALAARMREPGERRAQSFFVLAAALGHGIKT